MGKACVIVRCESCGMLFRPKSLPLYHCGIRHGEPCLPSDPDTRGYAHAAICRTNQCGKYNASKDSCQILVNIGKSGSVSWLYTHPNTRCPNDPPMWTITDGSTNAAAMDPRASRTQRHGDALAIEQQVGATAEDIAGR